MIRLLLSLAGASALAATALAQDEPTAPALDGVVRFEAAPTEDAPLVLVPPELPRQVRRAGLEGLCTARFTSLSDGSVDAASIAVDCAEEEHALPLVTAIERWKYMPDFVDGRAVGGDHAASVRFCADGAFQRTFWADQEAAACPSAE